MADEPHVIRGINWKETFPWTNLFRGFRVAIHPSKLLLALLALVILYLSGRLLDTFWTSTNQAVPNEIAMYDGSLDWASFDKDRKDARKAVETDYSALLVDTRYGVFKNDPDGQKSADAAADHVEKLGDLKDKINSYAHDSAGKIRDAYDKAYKDAKDSEKADLTQKRDAALVETYAVARADTRRAEQIKGESPFLMFIDYEMSCVNGVTLDVLQWNWFGNKAVVAPPANPVAGTERSANAPSSFEQVGVIGNVVNFFTVAPKWAFCAHLWYFIIWGLIFFIVWAFFGGAISRIAAVHVARDEKISVRQALKFSTGKFLSFFFAPIIPVVIIIVVGLIVSLGGLVVGNIPVAGGAIIGIFFFLAIAAGFVMALVLLGVAGGFNLMYPTIAVEGSDSFDAISRSFSYVYARPWRMLFYTLIAIVSGALTYVFVRIFVYLVLILTRHFVGMWVFLKADNGKALWDVIWPEPSFNNLTFQPDWTTLTGGQAITAWIVSIWMWLLISMVRACLVSYFLSINTIIYTLLRSDVDATDLDDVYLEQPDEEFTEAAPAASAPAAAAPAIAPASPPPADTPPASDAPPAAT